jgi:hypothetical protein
MEEEFGSSSLGPDWAQADGVVDGRDPQPHAPRRAQRVEPGVTISEIQLRARRDLPASLA